MLAELAPSPLRNESATPQLRAPARLPTLRQCRHAERHPFRDCRNAPRHATDGPPGRLRMWRTNVAGLAMSETGESASSLLSGGSRTGQRPHREPPKLSDSAKPRLPDKVHASIYSIENPAIGSCTCTAALVAGSMIVGKETSYRKVWESGKDELLDLAGLKCSAAQAFNRSSNHVVVCHIAPDKSQIVEGTMVLTIASAK